MFSLHSDLKQCSLILSHHLYGSGAWSRTIWVLGSGSHMHAIKMVLAAFSSGGSTGKGSSAKLIYTVGRIYSLVVECLKAQVLTGCWLEAALRS